MTLTIKLNPHAFEWPELIEAVEILRGGGVAAGPTQTFYGLMAAVDRGEALERILELKKRDADKPLLLLLDRWEQVADYAREAARSALVLAGRFWPGPLTLLLPAGTGLHPALVGPGGRVGLRVEGLDPVRTLVRLLDRAVTGTSANPGGAPPARTAEEAAAYFGQRLDLIIDGGPCPGGTPSTLVDCGVEPPRLVRSGAVPANQLLKALPELVT